MLLLPAATNRMLLCVGVLLVVACSWTPCSSFRIAVTGPRRSQRQRHQQHQRQQQQQQHHRSSFDSKNNYQSSSSSQRRTITASSCSSSFVFALRSATDDEYESESSEEIVSDDESSPPSLPKSNSNLAFNDVAESPAPPLNYNKYLTMQKKRVPVTIRYSAGSGLKPYYLTVAKRVKDLYPDVLIEREKLDKGGIEDGGGSGGDDARGTFEVAVDGKLVVRNRKATPERSVFVSMGEVDTAILRARKRRRPSTVYGENGVLATTVGDNNDGSGNGSDGNGNDIKDRLVKAHLEPLKQKALELSQQRAAKDAAAE